ncbi:MAG: MerR family transcriptional regulator [Burkholderiales bacterium]|nr:MerR family transcriptional regulator [Burkholderiales bacterium]
MKIGELAQVAGVSVDTLRYYEKQGLLQASVRMSNGYRRYSAEHLARLRFVRSAQALGFTLAQIQEILPQMAQGQFGRNEIEQRIASKMQEIDAQILALQQLKEQLQQTFAQLTCKPESKLAVDAATLAEHGPPKRVRRLQDKETK